MVTFCSTCEFTEEGELQELTFSSTKEKQEHNAKINELKKTSTEISLYMRSVFEIFGILYIIWTGLFPPYMIYNLYIISVNFERLGKIMPQIIQRAASKNKTSNQKLYINTKIKNCLLQRTIMFELFYDCLAWRIQNPDQTITYLGVKKNCSKRFFLNI